MRLPILATIALVLLASPLAGQKEKGEKIPKRPRLAAGADTNSALAFYMYGRSKLPKQPDEAASAFYWAARLAPQWAEPYYARRIALHLARRSQLVDYVIGRDFIVNSKESRQIDSLQYQALIRNPFFLPVLDRLLIDEVLYRLSDGEAYMSYGARTGDPSYDAWKAFLGGQYERAVRYYADAIKKYPKAPRLHASRARAFYALQAYDSAAAEMGLVLEKLAKEDSKQIVYFFDSRAMYEFSIGAAHVAGGDDAKAKEAYARALEADLSFYMAHAALGDIALRQRDTATALSEYDLAVQIKEDDAALRFGYALALIQANRAMDAMKQLERTVELEPYFALPYFYMGRLYDVAEMAEEAKAQYERFLARAAQHLDERQWVEERLATLKGAGQAGEAKP